MSNLGQSLPTSSIIEAKGWTTSEVPMMMRRSQTGISAEVRSKKRRGRSSPKKTMSGLTSELQSSQVGDESARTKERNQAWKEEGGGGGGKGRRGEIQSQPIAKFLDECVCVRLCVRL